MVEPSSGKERGDEFIVHLTACQNRLYAYVFSLLPDRERRRDVLQETNLVLWRKSDQFMAGTDFGAWACKVAYFEVLAERRRLRQGSTLVRRLCCWSNCRTRQFPSSRIWTIEPPHSRNASGGSVHLNVTL